MTRDVHIRQKGVYKTILHDTWLLFRVVEVQFSGFHVPVDKILPILHFHELVPSTLPNSDINLFQKESVELCQTWYKR